MSIPVVETKHRWWVLATVALAQLMVVLDATIVNIAMPSAQADLGFSDNDRQWIVTAYALAFGSLLLLGGRLADMFGRRRMFLIGLVGFAIASALGGAAQSFELLVAARALQGAFAAVLAPAALSVLTTTFTEPKERARAFGVFGAIAGMGGAIGLILGGFLTENFNWRWNLYVNVFIAAFAFVAGSMLLSKTVVRHHNHLDLSGILLASGGLFLLVFGFSQAEPKGWDSPVVWGSLAVSVILLVGFVIRQRTAQFPLLPLSIVQDRDRGASFLSILVAGSGMFGVFLFLTYYLQLTKGYSPIQTGFAFLPMVVAIVITAQLQTNLLVPRFGPKIIVPFGMAMGTGAMLWLSQLTATSGYGHVLIGLLAMGIGMGSIMPPSFQAATLGVPRSSAGAASAMVSTSQQVGGAIGTAVLNTIAATAATAYIADNQPAGPEVVAAGAIHSFSVTYTWAAGIFALGLILSASLFRTRADRAARLADAAPVASEEEPVLAH